MKKPDGMQNIKQTIIWFTVLISRYESNSNANDWNSFKKFMPLKSIYRWTSQWHYPSSFSRKTSSNKTQNNLVDYTIILVSVSSQCIPLLKPLPKNQVYLLFKELILLQLWNAVKYPHPIILIKTDSFPWSFYSSYSSEHPTATPDILFSYFLFF